VARRRHPPPQHLDAIKAGWSQLASHSFYGPLVAIHSGLVHLWQREAGSFPADGWVRISVDDSLAARRLGSWQMTPVMLVPNLWQRGTAAEWAHVLAQATLHVAFNHIDPVRTDEAWRRACEWEAVRFLRSMPVGTRPSSLPLPVAEPPGSDPAAVATWLEAGGPEALAALTGLGLAGGGQPTWVHAKGSQPFEPRRRQAATDLLAEAVRAAARAAVEEAGAAARGPMTRGRNPNSLAERARSWFVANYPLLAALAATFEVVEDAAVCQREQIAIAAVDSETRQVFINPQAPWTWETMRFVMAHELLHVGLRHEARRQGRDPFLWNVACDYVINGWLVQMGVGTMPPGCLLDIDLALDKESAEGIYDRIVRDLRLMRRLAKARTFRGVKLGDMLGSRPPAWWAGDGCDLDGFYRRALAEGLDLHRERCAGRGLLPGSLVEEIRSLEQRPIPWDVQLGHWLDEFFPPLERRRTYARASRRQSATPEIPRPVWERPFEQTRLRTFGAVLDTSGSMSAREIGRGLGAIAAYCVSRDVPFVRVVQCDTGAHDMGYVEPDRLVGSVEIHGRGGTVLQPAIRMLERADDFPDDAPILVITDGLCDALTISRPHAYLMPEGARLPFPDRSPRFAFEREASA
jgi:predicted metal-dependent peptidase